MKIFTFEVWHVHPDGGRASDRRDYNVIHETAAQAEATLRPGFGSAWRIDAGAGNGDCGRYGVAWRGDVKWWVPEDLNLSPPADLFHRQPGYSRPIGKEPWCPAADLNRETPASEAGDFTKFAQRGWCRRQDSNLRISLF
jgi:hypothetical protein